MKNSFLNLIVLACLSLSAHVVHSDSLEDLFYAGTASYSQGELEEALSSFLKYLEERPNDARAHLNLATIYAKQKKWGLSWAHYRMANALNPASEGLSDLKTRLEADSASPRGLSGPYHIWIRPNIVSLSTPLALGILLLGLTSLLHLLIRFLKKRKWAREAGEPLPTLPWTVLTLVFFSLICATILMLKVHIGRETYASVLSEQAKVFNAPSEEGFEIGNLEVGAEYKVLRTQEPWVQLTNESGTSGWVQSQFLLIYPGAL